MFDPGSMLILFALALMMVSPIHVTITRPRTGVVPIYGVGPQTDGLCRSRREAGGCRRHGLRAEYQEQHQPG